jgi:hypothetical protein
VIVLLLPGGLSCGNPPVFGPLTPGPGYIVHAHMGLYRIISDASPAETDRYVQVITRMHRHLVRNFVRTTPVAPLWVYLSRDRSSYNRLCRQATGADPDTPFGFYLSDKKCLLMNISTGTGTLAHELVHPFVEADFPAAPPWFNEGFASLYEQSIWTEGAMRGLVNWRLPGLQKAIREGKCPSLTGLMKDASHNFYSDDSGVKYALARHLCLYLQENSRLQPFYRSYRDGFSADPTGIRMLEAVTGKKTGLVEKELLAWIETLRY